MSRTGSLSFGRVLLFVVTGFVAAVTPLPGQQTSRLDFQPLPPIPDAIGVAGPLVGWHQNALLVAGGANFADPDTPDLWDVPKQYVDRIWIMTDDPDAGMSFTRQSAGGEFRLSQPVAYSAVVTTAHGLVCMGGENSNGPLRRAFLLKFKSFENGQWEVQEDDAAVPDLPTAATACSAALVGEYIYLVAGQIQDESGQSQASRIIWRLDLRHVNAEPDQGGWEQVLSWPATAPERTHAIVTAQHDGFAQRLYVIGGRRFLPGKDRSDLNNLEFLSDVWSFDPTSYDSNLYDERSNSYRGQSPWRRETDVPRPMSAGTAVPVGPAHVLVLAYADGSRIRQMLDEGVPMSRFEHPGFPKSAYTYHTVTRTWVEFGSMPANQVTTPAVKRGDSILLISGEIRPRVRTRDCWLIDVRSQAATFGKINMAVLVVYLMAMLSIGVYFTFRNKTTDDYFRGGKHVHWFVAGCSIFATMLSSITYLAIPAKAFAQDWVYAVGNVMILAVAPIAIYVALPFFRRIDATSAYEYLERRFNRVIRCIGSGSFSLFHVFRMGVVMALAAMALASVTPLEPLQCVTVMGVLSIVYCTLGGIEAVVWTDTVQTFVLLFGALACFVFAWLGAEPGSWQLAAEAGKFNIVNLDFGPASFTSMAIWVVVLGALGQNIASYTADQAVVQRYMTTPSARLAARSIWLNGLMAIPAALIFFGLGTALWMFYRSRPELLDPTIAADRIMPLFISQQLPVGLAGLVVAGIFSAAQSTVSTSMNSGATTIVTDFLRPFGVCKSEGGYLWSARAVTLAMGIGGTLTGLLFVNPEIKSLFDEFVSILGMFLGVLAGLFALGATTRRANGAGSLIGAIVAIAAMATIFFAAKDQLLLGFDMQMVIERITGFQLYLLHGYFYAFLGITICYVVGYVASWVTGGSRKPLDGLTLFTQHKT